MSTSEPRVISVSAVVLRDPDGHVLTVRKSGTERFMLPGGKPESGESAAETAAREVREEVGLDLDPASLDSLGVHRAAAANEDDHLVQAAVFGHPGVVDRSAVSPAAEIAELRWLAVDAPLPADLAPLLAQRVLPLLQRP